MKAILLNGSPRQGNTRTAVAALNRGFQNVHNLEIREIDVAEAEVSPCIACEGCGEEGRCVFDDDTNEIVGAVAEADVVIFATPVYWWGMTAQMKAVIDKFYSQVGKLQARKKKVGVVVIGEAAQDDPQYEIIPKQFRCICDYLGWELVFARTYTAGAAGDLAKEDAALAELEGLWEKF